MGLTSRGDWLPDQTPLAANAAGHLDRIDARPAAVLERPQAAM